VGRRGNLSGTLAAPPGPDARLGDRRRRCGRRAGVAGVPAPGPVPPPPRAIDPGAPRARSRHARRLQHDLDGPGASAGRPPGDARDRRAPRGRRPHEPRTGGSPRPGRGPRGTRAGVDARPRGRAPAPVRPCVHRCRQIEQSRVLRRGPPPHGAREPDRRRQRDPARARPPGRGSGPRGPGDPEARRPGGARPPGAGDRASVGRGQGVRRDAPRPSRSPPRQIAGLDARRSPGRAAAKASAGYRVVGRATLASEGRAADVLVVGGLPAADRTVGSIGSGRAPPSSRPWRRGHNFRTQCRTS
jgi:hypothetical protein